MVLSGGDFIHPESATHCQNVLRHYSKAEVGTELAQNSIIRRPVLNKNASKCGVIARSSWCCLAQFTVTVRQKNDDLDIRLVFCSALNMCIPIYLYRKKIIYKSINIYLYICIFIYL